MLNVIITPMKRFLPYVLLEDESMEVIVRFATDIVTSIALDFSL